HIRGYMPDPRYRDVTYSFCWVSIFEDRFDWLLLIGQHEEQYYYWLESHPIAVWLLRNRKGRITTQITCGFGTIRPQYKTEYLCENVLSLEQLGERLSGATLGND